MTRITARTSVSTRQAASPNRLVAATLLLLVSRHATLGFQPWHSTQPFHGIAADGTRPLHRSSTSASLFSNDERGNGADCADSPLASRRCVLDRTVQLASSLATSLAAPSAARATTVSAPLAGAPDPSAPPLPERAALLQALASKAGDEAVAQAIQRLMPLSPLGGSTDPAKYQQALDGEWKLLWFNEAAFSPLLELPAPFRPDSYQYFGPAAAREVGEGRVAQGLVGGVLASLGPETEVWLSSGAAGRRGDPRLLDIYPPFRFQLGRTPGSAAGAAKRTLVEADSDAEFRKANARSEEAQLAPKNVYEQMYLEDAGRGSLRISTIASGDPVIVGEIFVHQKL